MCEDGRNRNPGAERMRLSFASAVTEMFAFLEYLEFSVVEASPTLVRYRKGDLEVNVYHGRQSYELGFEIVRHGARYSLSEILAVTDSEAATRYRNTAATTKEVLNRGVARLAGLARRHAKQALEGDHEFFETLKKRRESWKERYALEVLEGQLRPQADEAFRQGDYRKAAELYEQIRSRLSPVELKKLALAKERGSL
jgi:hypothetical protein